MAQTQTMTLTTQTSGERRSLRKALRKWRDSLTSTKAPRSPQPSRTAIPAPHMSSRAGTPPRSSPQLAPASSPPADADADGVALFKATTQTVIHSPLDKRNRASNSSSPASTLRRSYLGSRRISAPADYFSLLARGGLVTDGGASDSPGHARRSSRLRFSFSKRASVHQQQQQTPLLLRTTTSQAESAQPRVSPVSSAPSPVAYANQHRTFQCTTAAEIAALAVAEERDLIDVGEGARVNEPKDWLDSGWREQETVTAARQMEEEGRKLALEERVVKQDMQRMGSVKLKSGNETVISRESVA